MKKFLKWFFWVSLLGLTSCSRSAFVFHGDGEISYAYSNTNPDRLMQEVKPYDHAK